MRSGRRPPLIMGILNVTPDSFSDGGRYVRPAAAVARAEAMAAEGAALIDVGGESTRPGAPAIPLDVELRRVIPVIRTLARRLRVTISVDTSKAEVARRAVEAGAGMINDVTALAGDPLMADVAAKAKVPVVLMHMRGTPRTMQRAPRYRDLIGEITAILRAAMARAERAGVRRERILLDPGIGFGKTVRHNLLLMRNLSAFHRLGRPLVIGPSRKSFIGRVTGAEAGDRVPGTLACVAAAMDAGVHIVRVHDVRAAAQFISMRAAIAEAA